MLGLIRRRRDDAERALARSDDPNPALALVVGLVYVFRTAAGARILHELEQAVRKYAADPYALWELVRNGQPHQRADVIDTTAETIDARPPALTEKPRP